MCMRRERCITYRNITVDILTNERIADDVYPPRKQSNTWRSLELKLERPIIPCFRGIGEGDIEDAHGRYNNPVRLVIGKNNPPAWSTVLRFVTKISYAEKTVPG